MPTDTPDTEPTQYPDWPTLRAALIAQAREMAAQPLACATEDDDAEGEP